MVIGTNSSAGGGGGGEVTNSRYPQTFLPLSSNTSGVLMTGKPEIDTQDTYLLAETDQTETTGLGDNSGHAHG